MREVHTVTSDGAYPLINGDGRSVATGYEEPPPGALGP